MIKYIYKFGKAKKQENNHKFQIIYTVRHQKLYF